MVSIGKERLETIRDRGRSPRSPRRRHWHELARVNDAPRHRAYTLETEYRLKATTNANQRAWDRGSVPDGLPRAVIPGTHGSLGVVLALCEGEGVVLCEGSDGGSDL